MGPKMNNIGKAFADPKIRGIFIIFGVIIVIVFSIIYFRFKAPTPAGVASNAGVSHAPAIGSIPGGTTSSREYVKLQEMQNVQLSEEAAKKSTAAIPTITRATYIDTGTGDEGNGCSVEDLKRSRNAGVTASELRCRGCSLTALKAAGFSAGELREAGFSAAELKAAGYSVAELKAAGFSAQELQKAGFSARELAQAGFSAAELKAAGFGADEVKAAGLSAADLRAAGFSANELAKAGFGGKEMADAGFSAVEMKKAGFSDGSLKSLGFSDQAIKSSLGAKNCSVAELRKLHVRGIKPEELRNLGCSLAALKAAGFTAAELKAAGYSAKDLKDAGFTAAELKAAGFSAKDLKNAGFSAQELKDAGFSAAELKDAGFSAGELKRAGFSADALKSAGFSAKELRDAGFSPQELQKAGFTADDLKAAGFSDGDLVRAGFMSSQGLPAVTTGQSGGKGCSVEQLRQDRADGITVQELKGRGCGATAIKAAGFSAAELKAAGFNNQDLADAGVSSEEIAALQQGGPGTENVSSTVGGPGEGGESANKEEWQRQLAILRAQQAQQMSAQEYQDKIKQMQQAMSTQANDLFAAWSPLPAQQFVQGTAEQNAASGGKKVAGDEGKGAAASSTAPNPNANTLKAGSILFAVLDTAINSDEKSPVMATVVDGDLKGAKVLGEFRRADKRVVLEFKTLNVPYLPSSITFDAVAIDPNTARTALATHVDNHYLLRYGTIFAASFMSGLGQAVQDSGNSVQINTSTGENINFHGSTNISKAAVVGLGEVGNKFSQVLTPITNTPPTVEVKAGSGMGLLLRADLSIPKQQQ